VSITFDRAGFEYRSQDGLVGWYNPLTGVQITVWKFDKVPDLPAPLENIDALRHGLAVNAAEVGCLIEAYVTHLDGAPTVTNSSSCLCRTNRPAKDSSAWARYTSPMPPRPSNSISR
jgi:hypothetical protein